MKHTKTVKDEWEGKLEGFPQIQLDQVRGTPVSFDLEMKEKTNNKDENTFSYKLVITIHNDNGLPFYGRYGFPYPVKAPDYEYGHGFGGLMKDAPESILNHVSEITGVNLTELK